MHRAARDRVPMLISGVGLWQVSGHPYNVGRFLRVHRFFPLLYTAEHQHPRIRKRVYTL